MEFKKITVRKSNSKLNSGGFCVEYEAVQLSGWVGGGTLWQLYPIDGVLVGIGHTLKPVIVVRDIDHLIMRLKLRFPSATIENLVA